MRSTPSLLTVLCAALLALLPACNAQAQAKPDLPAPEAIDLLNKIEAATAKLDTLKARLRYTRTQTITGDVQIRFGDFYYQAQHEDRPTRFAVLFDSLRIDNGTGKPTRRPMQTWYIFDGNWLLERDHDAKQAVRREMVPKGAEREGVISLGDGQMPIPLKLKADEMTKAYQVTRLEDEQVGDQTLHQLSLTPRKGGEDASAMRLWFDSKTMLLFKLTTTEDADEIEIVFPKPEVNVQIKPEVFDTKLPKKADGWDVNEVPIKE